jgi:ABC-type multidrug transport system fused ATPase/permease subunit
MSRTYKHLPFTDVLRFTASYWLKQPFKFSLAVSLIVLAAFAETCLPSALAAFLSAIREHAHHSLVLFYLSIFLGIYFVQVTLLSASNFAYNFFETHLFKALQDDAFSHVLSLPEAFFVSTFTGSIITRINRARSQIELFEDQLLIRIVPTFLVLISTLAFLSLRFPLLALLMAVYLVLLIIITSLLVFKFSGPAQGEYANAQDLYGAHLADNISGITTIKAYAQESFERSRFMATTAMLRQKNFHSYLRSNLASAIQRLLLAGMLVLMMGGGT